MKTIQKIIVFYLLLTPIIGMAETKEIPFTLDDRDRIIRTEQKVESLRTELNSKIDTKFDALHSEMNARFDQLFSFLWAIIGIFTTMMVSIFGFAFWDRKLSLAPMKKDYLKTLTALRDYSEYQPKLKEILKSAGLL
ncbi:MAG: hypothetical protein NT004_06445 [Bacteroidetes bacterium]|nr:hypothetical protein [Bacteroidota bacterium]